MISKFWSLDYLVYFNMAVPVVVISIMFLRRKFVPYFLYLLGWFVFLILSLILSFDCFENCQGRPRSFNHELAHYALACNAIVFSILILAHPVTAKSGDGTDEQKSNS